MMDIQNCKKVIQELIRSKLTAVQRIEIASERIEYNDIIKSVLQSDMDK